MRSCFLFSACLVPSKSSCLSLTPDFSRPTQTSKFSPLQAPSNPLPAPDFSHSCVSPAVTTTRASHTALLPTTCRVVPAFLASAGLACIASVGRGALAVCIAQVGLGKFNLDAKPSSPFQQISVAFAHLLGFADLDSALRAQPRVGSSTFPKTFPVPPVSVAGSHARPTSRQHRKGHTNPARFPSSRLALLSSDPACHGSRWQHLWPT